jgi:hypothetical protein
MIELPIADLQYFIVSDESVFTLKQKINRQKTRFWLESKPDDEIELPLQDEKVMVWCGLSSLRVYGSYFFESNVNQHTYLDMLKNRDYLLRIIQAISYLVDQELAFRGHDESSKN